MVKEIPLSQGKVALVDDEDYERVSRYNWYAHQSTGSHTYYAVRNRRKGDPPNAPIKMHRYILGVEGATVVDHQDGNGLNNQRSNIRPCTQKQNLHNRRANVGSSSIYRGVIWDKRLSVWRAQLKYEGKNHYLGNYERPEDAAHAYDEKAKDLFGDFARLNFPQAA